MQKISLSYQHQRLDLYPSLGAATACYYMEIQGKVYHFLRPTPEKALLQNNIEETANFLMAPWAGRIQNGQFTYEGKHIHYPSKIKDFAHSMHGFARDMEWIVIDHCSHTAHLKLHYQKTQEWPFSFKIEQIYTLTDKGLSIQVMVENTGDTVMPFSMGYHPFFPCDSETRLYANVQKAWYSDEELMPTHLGDHPLVHQLSQGFRVQDTPWDIILTGWDKQVFIQWADRQLRYEVSSPFDFLVLYNPRGKDWFCAEPFGNITDSFNLRQRFPREQIGGMDMKPAQVVTATVYLMPEVY
ncbi:hypothetical protein F9B74_06520 [Pelistega sp. NLN82]|uniref:Aldose 1-epimerase n=1 Tax=Pelistega ratti TaxID=2652177 RepID=A0A6L9Y6P0_9BURK|nr:hypothetical protein [Pelistega ratti]NEN75976.1 hypothetical protein [Pelistega ratti]